MSGGGNVAHSGYAVRRTTSRPRFEAVDPLKTHLRAVAALLTLILSAGVALPAFASPLSTRQAEAAVAQAQLTALRSKAEAAAEAYNQAHDNYLSITAKVNVTKARVATLTKKQDQLQTALGTRADAMYRSDDALGVIEMLLSARSIEDFNSVLEALRRLSEQDAATVAQLKETRAQLQTAEATLVSQQAEAAVVSAQMKQRYDEANAQEKAAQRLYDGLAADVRRLIAQEQAAAEAAAEAAWKAAHPDTGSGGSRGDSSGGSNSDNSGSSTDNGGNPPSSSAGAAAVAWARKAIGSWYQWGSDGPSTFDCSGLTKWAYSHAGVSLPHYSRAQYDAGPHVARANLQPGDLVFFGSPIHHVGIYVGGGQFIEAPYTGAKVRIASLGNRSDFVGACRPN